MMLTSTGSKRQGLYGSVAASYQEIGGEDVQTQIRYVLVSSHHAMLIQKLSALKPIFDEPLTLKTRGARVLESPVELEIELVYVYDHSTDECLQMRASPADVEL